MVPCYNIKGLDIVVNGMAWGSCLKSCDQLWLAGKEKLLWDILILYLLTRSVFTLDLIWLLVRVLSAVSLNFDVRLSSCADSRASVSMFSLWSATTPVLSSFQCMIWKKISMSESLLRTVTKIIFNRVFQDNSRVNGKWSLVSLMIVSINHGELQQPTLKHICPGDHYSV